MDIDLSPRPWEGGPVTDVAYCVLAGNPSPMTLDGTNTWLLRAPGASTAVVVDPGPDDEDHLAAVLDAAYALDVRIGLVLLTHGHLDHSEGAAHLAELAGVSSGPVAVRAAASGDLAEGDVLELEGLRVEVLATPGHTSDSMSFVLPDAGLLLTGDTVLGRGTSIIAHPDGRLGPYLESLERLRELVGQQGVQSILPGHGPVTHAPDRVLDRYLRHRRERLEQVRAVVEEGITAPADVVRHVYADVDPQLWPAAELSVRAQLDYLAGSPA